MPLSDLVRSHAASLNAAAKHALGIDCTFPRHCTLKKTQEYELSPGLVSVVLPVYNQAEYLQAAIESVLRQSYIPIELIIVNDGSTDEAESVLCHYLGAPGIHILKQSHLGLPKALSTGFDHAKGEFWTWTSADNLMEPRMLEVLVGMLQENPDVGMVYADYQLIDQHGAAYTEPFWRAHNRPDPASGEVRLPRSAATLQLFRDNFIGPCFLYWGWLGRQVGQYHEPLGFEDYNYWLRIKQHAEIIHVGIDDILYKYRVHSNCLSARMMPAR